MPVSIPDCLDILGDLSRDWPKMADIGHVTLA